jgi:2-polyprenyl-6-hydroxyphenyl methylase/3-demethylubiquinone-9 3-methyltransferase
VKPSGEYYSDHLSAERLQRCYDVAPPRVQQYLRAEIDFVQRHIDPRDSVLELGCGFGRALSPIAGGAGRLVGIDTSVDSVEMALATIDGCQVAAMDAARLALTDGSFDVVFCIQNGLAVFGVERWAVVAEAIRVSKPGATVLFSGYSELFWEERLDWFRIQSAHGLLGEIDEEATGGGVIVCEDGFRAETTSRDELARLSAATGFPHEVVDVDGSSVFCVISVP